MGNWYLMGQFQLGKMKRFWRWMGDGCTTMRVDLMPLSCTLKNG